MINSNHLFRSANLTVKGLNSPAHHAVLSQTHLNFELALTRFIYTHPIQFNGGYMFEYDQNIVDSLLHESQGFSRLHTKHTDLNTKIDLANEGKNAIDDLSLEQLKKQKLLIKDQMAMMIKNYQRASA